MKQQLKLHEIQTYQANERLIKVAREFPGCARTRVILTGKAQQHRHRKTTFFRRDVIAKQITNMLAVF